MKKQILIPETKEDIKFKDFINFEKYTNKDNDEDFLNQKILEIFFGISYEEFRGMNPSDYDSIITSLLNTLQKKAVFQQIINLEGVEYGFIPKFDSISTGELLDLDNYLKNKDFYSLLSILYRPITEKKKDKYLIEKYNGAKPELFENIDLGTYESCIGFFLRLLQQLERITQKYLENNLKVTKKMKNTMTKEQILIAEQNMNSVKNGLHTFNLFGDLQMEIF